MDLRFRVKNYMEFIWKTGSKTIEKEQRILHDLPNSLREEILLESHGKLLREFEILKKNFSSDFIDRLSLRLKPVSYAPKDIIYSVIYDILISIGFSKKNMQSRRFFSWRKGKWI